jgi:flavin reductase (DIM6/NTAB) family NADH-FMN oxidoreductase RutF
MSTVNPIDVTSEDLKSVMRAMPSPVTVVTARGNNEIRGATIGSFTSLSMNPPLISINLERGSQMHSVMTGATKFAVHFPSKDQAHLGTRFAKSDTDSKELFEDIPYSLDDHGTPIIHNTRGVIHCVKHANFLAGDHNIIVGMVTNTDQIEDHNPLLYFNRQFHELGSATE